MYVGRIVGVGKTSTGRNVALYRLSSRSFPNREIVERDGTLAVVAKEGLEAEAAKSRYVSYKSMQSASQFMVIGNGSHTEVIVSLINSGEPIKQAMEVVLAIFDFERDGSDTPRIAAVVPRFGNTAFLGIVTKHSLEVREIDLRRGECSYLSTYGPSRICSCVFPARKVKDIAKYLVDDFHVFSGHENPVATAAALFHNGRWVFGINNLN